ncbi:HNH endonuclease [Priestia megaterium]|jgi:uncharacterized protein (TIGR02646 family)|uniref:HNH endonuclease n=1 Tax=Priestia TaxID=2800373 RepID=UPI000BEB986C|nr:HNH endonuclease [Priestia megaterium]PEB61877.1 HNH endonuclease [Priestia megaterium]PEE75309.1 HNH endonuclease [Priestia megaterium]PFI87856.1 HNH endonuclease [Priestia megaterium]PGR15927.1 HNH endonuclease [Priestia megaterium]
MIKLTRATCPKELTNQVQQELTKHYKETGNSVWKKTYIERALLRSSHNKCAYCECNIKEESKYMEVEHFHDKKTHPNDVVNWINLLPSCKRCNGKKSTFNTREHPFINPYDSDPKEHLIFNQYSFFPTTEAGKNTIDQLFLNDLIRVQTKRFEIGSKLIEKIEELYEKVCDYKNGNKTTTRTKHQITDTIENLMIEALPNTSYCATVATVMTNNVHFLTIIDILKQLELWSSDMDKTFSEINKYSLDTDISKSVSFLQSV